jgi:hypothetical protein
VLRCGLRARPVAGLRADPQDPVDPAATPLTVLDPPLTVLDPPRQFSLDALTWRSSPGSSTSLRCVDAVTVFGVTALTFMMVMYSLDQRDRRFILGFALGCALSSVYGFLAGAWPFGVIEAIWCVVALRRFAMARSVYPPD